MDWGSSRKGFRIRGRILAPHIPAGILSGSPVAVALVALVTRYCLQLFTLVTTHLGMSEVARLHIYLASGSGRQQHYLESLTLDAEKCDDEEEVQSVSHGSPGMVSPVV